MEWSDLQYFLALATEKTLPKAAEQLGVNRTTVSRRIAELESSLGTRLFERKGRTLVLTPAGVEALAVARNMEGELTDLGRRLFGRDEQLAGVIRLTTSAGIADLISKDLAAFGAQHPEVVLEISVSNAQEDLELMESDMALRLTGRPPDNLVGRKLVDMKSALYANADLAAATARGEPVGFVAWVGQPDVPDWVAEQFACQRITVTTNSVAVVTEFVAAGAGISDLPCHVGELDDRLVRISAPRPFRMPEVWLLYHPQLRSRFRIHVLADYLTEVFNDKRAAFAGELKGGEGPRTLASPRRQLSSPAV